MSDKTEFEKELEALENIDTESVEYDETVPVNPEDLLYDEDEKANDKRPPRKLSLLSRALEFLSKLGKKSEKGADFENYSHFKKYLNEMDKKDENFAVATAVAELCDEALTIARSRVSLANKIQVIDESVAELECFNQLSDEEASKFKSLLNSFVSLTREVSVLRNQIIEFDGGLIKLTNLEDDANKAIPDIEEAEKNFRALRSDINYLRGEKSELEHERALLINGYDFVNKFSVAMIVIFTLTVLLLGYLAIFNGAQIFYPATILVVVLIGVVTLCYFFRRRLRFELLLNQKKQKKAIELVNRKIVVLAHYRNFLSYVYTKYKVRSAKMLKSNISDFQHYKHISARLDAVRKIMYETERQIEVFLRENKFGNIRSSIEKFAKTINIDDKKRYYNDLAEQKTALENNLNELDKRHEEIWDALVELNEKDRSSEHIIDRIIQAYLDEVTKVIGKF